MVTGNFQNIRKARRTGAAAAPSTSAFLNDLKIEYLSLERLRRSPNNPRTHSNKQLKQIAKSIARFGFVNPALISDDFEIIAGHGRVEAAKLLGLKQVPTVRLSNLSPADRRAYVIADNRLAQLAGWDHELLAIELRGLIDLKIDDVEVTGFSLPEIELILEQPVEARADAEGEASTERKRAVSRLGDVWVLGPHRLQCGGDELLDCDVIVRRWQRYSGNVARLEGSNLTFKDVETMRVAALTTSTVSKAWREGVSP